MKGQAARIDAPRRAGLVEVDLPAPERDEVRVRLLGCGVCGSDLPVWQGREWFEYPRPPGAPGHEAWGVVEATGRTALFAPGDRVAGLVGDAYRDLANVPADRLVPIPDDMADGPMPVEAIACAVNAFARSGIREGDVVVVIGVGFLGALLVQMAHHAGAEVIAVSRRRFALETARTAGADVVLSAEADDVEGAVFDHTRGRLADVVIEAAGKQQTLDLAARLTRERGRMVIVGYHQESPRQVDMQLWNWRGIDVINAHEREPRVYLDGMRRSFLLMRDGIIDPHTLITHTFALDQIDKAFDALETRPEGFLKGVVRA